MKTYILFFAIVVIGMSFTFTTNPTESATEPIVECKVSIISAPESPQTAFFEMEISAEEEDVYYSLKREFDDGRFETVQSIKIQSIIPSDEQLPSFYSFKDQQVPNEDFTYMLMRIAPKSKTFNVIQRWDYCSETQSLCSTGMLASNDG